MKQPSSDFPRRVRGFAYAAGLILAGAATLTGLYAASSTPAKSPVAVQVDEHPVNRGARDFAQKLANLFRRN